MKETDVNTELLKVDHLDLEVEGSGVYPDLDFSLYPQRGVLITGPDEEANVLLLKTLGGLVPPPAGGPGGQGRVLFQGMDIYNGSEAELKKVKQKVAFVFREGTMISNLTIRENLLLPYRFYYPEADGTAVLGKLAEALHFFGIPGVPGVLDSRPALVSYRVKKKLALVRASLQDPQLILVEKPMFNLDEEDQEQVLLFLENLKKQGIALVMVSHCRSILEKLTDEAIVLEKGKAPAPIPKTHREFPGLARYTFFH